MPELMSRADKRAMEKWTRLFDEADKFYAASTTEEQRDKWYDRRERAAIRVDGISARVHRRQNVITRSKFKKKRPPKVEPDTTHPPSPFG
jgi:hypothetical protein